MSENSSPYTHFDMCSEDLPPEYYAAIGRALYRWSQLEATVCALATSIQGPSWLLAIKELRGPNGFKVKNVFQKLNAEARKRGASPQLLEDLSKAERLYSLRKTFFHSIWGHVTGPERAAVGIQEWSNDTYDNFRPIALAELEIFAADCAATSGKLMKNAVPLFHGSDAIVVNEGDGLTQGYSGDISS